MDPERWRRTEAIFHRALELDGDERAAYLDQACQGDDGLRAEVDRLVALDGASADLGHLGGTGDPFDAIDRPSERPRATDHHIGRSVGPYRLVERIGSGGMGVVYRATRSDGLFEQDVAVKLLRAEHATDWLLRRFAFERRALAALEHPAIARLYDGGTTEDGAPYFVMELVRGEPIDVHCRRLGLSIERRVRLAVEVCRAVQHAHRTLIVHCDLKPANILIDGEGRPHLLDFGIARYLDDPEAGVEAQAARPARTISRVLTPGYACPEQLAGAAVTTSFDVYALGVVLYELISGSRPFELATESLVAWERHVRVEQPAPPSARTQGPRPPSGGVRPGDLDRIILMALRKEPERRYASVQEFADDLERLLLGLPVRARPNSFGYLAASFVRRHRLGVAAGLVVAGAIAAGYASAKRSERIAEREAEHARMEADSFQSIAGFLMDGFLPAQPADDPAWLARARARIDAQGTQVRREYAASPHQRANMLDTLGQVCRRLDLSAEARSFMEEAAAIRRDTYGDSSIEYALSLRSLGQLAYDDGDYAQASDVLGRALALHRTAGTTTHTDVAALANDLAACLRNLGRAAEAEELHREALALRRADDPRGLPVAESLNNLAGLEMARRNYPEAIQLLEEALAIRSAILGDGHLLTSQTCSNLATVAWRAGRADDAVGMFARAERGYRALGLDGEEGLAVVLANRSAVDLAQGRPEAATAALDEALSIQRRRLRPDHPLIATSLVRLARARAALGRGGEATSSWDEALRIRRASGIAPRDLAEALAGLGGALAAQGACERAEPLLREAAALHASASLDDPLGLGRIDLALASCLAARGDSAEAASRYLDAVRLLDGHPEADAGEVERARRGLESARGGAPHGPRSR